MLSHGESPRHLTRDFRAPLCRGQFGHRCRFGCSSYREHPGGSERFDVAPNDAQGAKWGALRGESATCTDRHGVLAIEQPHLARRTGL